MLTWIRTRQLRESEYHSIPMFEGKSFTTEGSSIKFAVFTIQNYASIYQFCKINGSARIHISVNLWRFSWGHKLIPFPPWVDLWRHYLTFPPSFEFMTSSSTAGHEGLERALHKTNLSFQFVSCASFGSYITLIVKINWASWGKLRKLNIVIVQPWDWENQSVFKPLWIYVFHAVRLWPITTTPMPSGRRQDVKAIVIQLDCLGWIKKTSFLTFFQIIWALLWSTMSSATISTISMLRIRPWLKQLMLRCRKSSPSSWPKLLSDLWLLS